MHIEFGVYLQRDILNIDFVAVPFAEQLDLVGEHFVSDGQNGGCCFHFNLSKNKKGLRFKLN